MSSLQTLLDSNVFTSDTAGLRTFACVTSIQTLLDSNVFTSDTAGLCTFACLSPLQTLLESNVFNSDTAGLCTFARVFTSDTAGLQCHKFRHCWALHVCSCALLKHIVSPSRVYFYVFPVCTTDASGPRACNVCELWRVQLGWPVRVDLLV